MRFNIKSIIPGTKGKQLLTKATEAFEKATEQLDFASEQIAIEIAEARVARLELDKVIHDSEQDAQRVERIKSRIKELLS